MDVLQNALEREEALRHALVCVASGVKFDTETAKILAEHGFTVRHDYFDKGEYVKLYECTGYPIQHKDWDYFFKSRKDFPERWSIVK